MNLTNDNLTAIILAGGLGTRLTSVVKDVPKVMALINGLPFLEYQIQYIKLRGIYKIVLCVSYLREKIIEYFGDGNKFGVKIRYAIEKEQLGTGGAIKNAINNNNLTEYLLVLNGDTFAKWHLDRIKKKYLEKNADAIMVIAPIKNRDVSLIEIDDEGRINTYIEKPNKSSGLTYTGVGVYLFHKDLTQDWPNRAFSLEHECLPEIVKSRKVYSEIIDSGFFDIGTPERLETFKRFVTEEENNLLRTEYE